MDATAWAAAIGSWHDFYLAIASASAALLGLLFVGVSINLASITAAERVGLRTRADLAFSNLLYLLGISLIALIPSLDAGSLAISLAFVAGLGLLRLGRRAVGLVHHGRRAADLHTIRRMAWTLVADLMLLFVAARLPNADDAHWLLVLPVAAFLLLVGSADVAWSLLVLDADRQV